MRSALLLERLRLESARPDGEREAGYQQRDHALIEGVLRQTIQSPEARLAIGWGVGLGWLAWLSLSGRAPRGGRA